MPPAQFVQGAFLLNDYVSKARNSLSYTGALSLFDEPVLTCCCVTVYYSLTLLTLTKDR